MDRKNALLAVLVGLALAATATMAAAHDRTRVYWTTRPCGCVVHVRHVVRIHRVVRVPVRYVAPPPLPLPPPVIEREREVEVIDNSVSLPMGFFADSGGVGPAFIDTGGGGGGGFVIAQGGAFAGARASASASATISIGFRGRGHGMPPHMMPHGCGCGHK